MRVAVVGPANSQAGLEAFLGCLHSLNVLYLETQNGVPALYTSGVFYRRSPPFRQEERWLTIPEVQRLGAGDCKHLAAWRSAELVASGEDARARPEIYLVRPGLWHVVVRRGDGTIEDLSKNLGMAPAEVA